MRMTVHFQSWAKWLMALVLKNCVPLSGPAVQRHAVQRGGIAVFIDDLVALDAQPAVLLDEGLVGQQRTRLARGRRTPGQRYRPFAWRRKSRKRMLRVVFTDVSLSRV